MYSMHSFADFCFVCLIHTKNLTNISSKDNEGIVHEQKLKHILQELANFQPKVPKYICTNCLNNLNVIYKFREKCLQNFVTLNKCIEQLKTTEGYKNLSVSLMIMKRQMIQEAINSVDQAKTKTIEKVFVKSENYDEQSNTKDVEFISKSVHQSNAINNEENSVEFEIVIKREPGEVEEILPNDNLRTSFEQCLHKHNTLVKTELNTTSDDEMRDSLASLTGENNIENYTESTGLAKQEDGINFETPTFEYVSISNITGQPSPKPNNTKTLKCKVCCQQFPSLKSLRTHVNETHIDNVGFECEICKKKYIRKMHLTRHMKTHEGVQYDCPVCLKKFSQKNNMDIHMKIHNDSRDFECVLCQKRFLQKHHLQDHLRLHIGAKTFQCSVCAKPFTQRVNMLQHEKIHAGVRDYECSFCQKSYTQMSNLKTHLLMHNRKYSKLVH